MASRFWKGSANRGPRMMTQRPQEPMVMNAAVRPIPKTDPLFPETTPDLPIPAKVSSCVPVVSRPAKRVPSEHAHGVPLLMKAAPLCRVLEGDLNVRVNSDAPAAARDIANAVEPHTTVLHDCETQEDLDAIIGNVDDVKSLTGRSIAHRAAAGPVQDGMLAPGSGTRESGSVIPLHTSLEDESISPMWIAGSVEDLVTVHVAISASGYDFRENAQGAPAFLRIDDVALYGPVVEVVATFLGQSDRQFDKGPRTLYQ